MITSVTYSMVVLSDENEQREKENLWGPYLSANNRRLTRLFADGTRRSNA